VILGYDIATAGGEIRQQIHDLGPDLSRQAILRQSALSGLNKPVVQAKVATETIGHDVVTQGPQAVRLISHVSHRFR
jgi:hypothetical protein